MAVSRKPAIVNFVTLFLSLALIAFSVAIFSLTGHGMRKLDHAFPSGRYNWYTQHWITLRYNTANEGLMLAAAALSCVTGLISIIRPLFVQKTPTPTPTPNLTQSLLFIPSLIALFITFGALIYTSISISTNNYGECRSITGYNDCDAILACPREVAACLITHYFDDASCAVACGEPASVWSYGDAVVGWEEEGLRGKIEVGEVE